VFEASHPFRFFDYFRVPYRLAQGAELASHLPERHPLRACGHVRWTGRDGSTRSLYWPLEQSSPSPGRYQLGSIALFGTVVPDSVTRSWLNGDAGSWWSDARLTDAGGTPVASVWRDQRGNVFVPFDPGEAIWNYWSEGYQAVDRAPLKALAKRAYYRVRPAIPRPAQIQLRRLLSRVQIRTRFPSWPIETGLHDLYEVIFGWLREVAREPFPWIAPWPEGKSWALVLTHDVETAVGYRHLHLMREREEAGGYRSSWNFVPKRYAVGDEVVRELQQAGFEVGVHGLYHDGRDLGSLELLRKRVPVMRQYAERWGAVGFRSPATRRRWEWMPLLGFEYDSSYPDTDPFEPDAGGCCSWLPYFNEDLVELPLTVTQDHTLFTILRQRDERAWIDKTSFLKQRGGMALLLTHPDYMLSSSLLDAYSRFLDTFAADPGVWRALPREVSEWWRRRAASHLEAVDGDWRIVGPAAHDGRVTLTAGRD
jgi:hypothetical protein